MPNYSTEPVTREAAVAHGQRATRAGIWLLFLGLMSGFVAVVAALFLVDDPTARPAWVTFLIAGSLCALLCTATRFQNRKVRYRITAAYSPLRLVAAYVVFGLIIAAVILTFSALGIEEHPAAKVVRPLFVVGAVGVVPWHMAATTLFQANWHLVIVRRSRIAWDAVDALVLARGTKAGTTELGVVVRPGVQVAALPVRPGETLPDLPLRVVLPTAKLDLDRLHWAMNQSGRTDIALLERTERGDVVLRRSNTPPPPQHPYRAQVPPQQRW